MGQAFCEVQGTPTPVTWPTRMSAPPLRQIGQCHGCEREHEYEYDDEYEQEEEKRGEGDGMPGLAPLRISTQAPDCAGGRAAVFSLGRKAPCAVAGPV